VTRPPPERPGWDLSFLRVGALATAAVAGVAALVAGLVGGWADAAGVLVGAAVVAMFFIASGVVVAWAGRINDTFTLPAALGMFFVKAIVLFGILNALPEDGWLDRLTMAWAVIVGALLWSGVQLRWVWTRPIYYVAPPAPPGQATVPPAPERPTTDG
jgi:hypothetical protein